MLRLLLFIISSMALQASSSHANANGRSTFLVLPRRYERIRRPFTSRQYSHPHHACHRYSLRMVRNIDLPEAIIFYGVDNFQTPNGTSLLPGVESLLRECREVDAAAILVVRQAGVGINNSNNEEGVVEGITAAPTMAATTNQHKLHIQLEDYPAPNPRALWNAIHEVTIQPKGFGGSSGFGKKAPDPERSPLAKHVVVLCSDEDACRAARFVGMRVVCRYTSGLSLDNINNDLADAMVSSWDEFGIDDIATPGSYWLNPPHARDDDGNRVDPLEVMEYYESTSLSSSSASSSGETTTTGIRPNYQSGLKNSRQTAFDESDDEWARILADLDPLD